MTINVRSSDLLFKTEKDVDTVMRKLHKISANGNPDFVISFKNFSMKNKKLIALLALTGKASAQDKESCTGTGWATGNRSFLGTRGEAAAR